jgi:hypothetical protein
MPLDDDTRSEKPTLTPKVKPPLQPVCTLMSDCSLQFETNLQIGPLDLQRMLLSAAATLTARILQHSMVADRVLAKIAADFDGIDEETQRAIQQVLGGGG